jgi:DNA mismatch repair protein MutL
MDLLARYSNAKPEIPASAQYEVNALPKTEKELPSVDVEDSVVHEYKLVGEAFNCYLILEIDNVLLIIDKHAAHERIIFEDLKRGRKEDRGIASQKLLLPITVVMTPDEAAAANDCRVDFESVGFEFEIQDRAVDILAIPNLSAPSHAEALYVSMLGEIISEAGNPQNSEDLRRERALYQVACKAAIKGGREYDASVTDWLIKRVLSLPDITVCPHGRPIAYKLKKSELDRQFDRLK